MTEKKEINYVIDKNNWASYNGYPETFLKANSALTEMGFDKVYTRITPLEQPYNKLTLIICPSYNPLGSYRKFTNQSNYFEIPGYLEYNGRYESSVKDKLTAIEFTLDRDLYACYLKDQNLVILIYPINSLSGKKNEFLDFILNKLKEDLKKADAKTVKIDTTKVILNRFKGYLTDRVLSVKSSIQAIEADLKYREEAITSVYRSINTHTKELEVLTKSLDNLDDRLKVELAKLKIQKFVKKLRTEGAFIVFDTPPITIKHRNKDYQLGTFKICISADVVNIRNNNPVKNDHEEYIHHPHIYATADKEEYGSICWGSFAEKEHKLLSNFELKDLAVLLLIWLNTYNPPDKWNPIENFPYIDKNGKLIAGEPEADEDDRDDDSEEVHEA